MALPRNYLPRPYQIPFLKAMRAGCTRAVLVWHRRAGKDTTAFNWLLQATQLRKGTYYYLFPTFTQAKKVIWQGMNREGMGLLEHIPPELIESKNETDLRIQLRTGSAIQLIGTDNVDAVRGTNPIGMVFSEYAQQSPVAWEVLAPILEENGGWAVFVYTPYGANHGKTLFDRAQTNPAWFCQRLTIDDTDVFDADFIARKRTEGHDEQYLQQEYFCSFSGSVQGAFYAEQLDQAERDGRVTRVPYDPQYPVETACDIGTTKDAYAIWFYQQIGRRVQLIDYFEETNVDLARIKNVLLQERRAYGYLAGQPHLAPHDIEKTEFGTGRTIRDLFRDIGLEFRVVPKMNHWERIVPARALFPRCYFDAVKCEAGLRALRHYHREWDDETRSFNQKEHKDWSNHGADAFGHLAVGIEAPYVAPPVTQAVTDFNVFDDRRPFRGHREPQVERDFAPFAA